MLVVINFANNSSVTDRSSHPPKMCLLEMCCLTCDTDLAAVEDLTWTAAFALKQHSSYLAGLCCPSQRGEGAAAPGRNAQWCGRSPQVSRCCRSRAPRWWWGRCPRWRGWSRRRCCGARCPWCPWGSAPADTQSRHCHTHCCARGAQGTARAALAQQSHAYGTEKAETCTRAEKLELPKEPFDNKAEKYFMLKLDKLHSEVVNLKPRVKSDIWTSSITEL